MNSDEIQIMIELILFPRVISPMEPLIKEKMTQAEKIIAKNECYNSMKKAIDEFCNEYNTDPKTCIEKLQKILESRKNTLSELVKDVLDTICQKQEEQSNDGQSHLNS